MSSKVPANGAVITYPYLWRWQRDKGETEGRKERPVCLMLAIRQGKETHLVLLAISGTPPASDQTTLVIPALERQRAGLKEWKEAWITVSEYNHDIAELSFYYEPHTQVLGQFSKAFLGKIAAAARPFITQQSARISRL